MLQIAIDGKNNNFISKFKVKTNNNLPRMICYESIVKNIVDVAIFMHNSFIFSCGWFQYDILFYFILF